MIISQEREFRRIQIEFYGVILITRTFKCIRSSMIVNFRIINQFL